MKSNRINDLSWIEYQSNTNRLLIIPIGATEQHGPHLPLAVDSILAEQFAYRLSQRVDALVAPTISYGYKSKPMSGGGPLFPGTIDLNGSTLQKLISDILSEFIKDSFSKILILNAHFENEPFIIEAMDEVSQITGDKAKIVLTNWWDPMPEDILPQIFDVVPFPGWALEHAAITETSLMMYFQPEMVREDLIEPTAPVQPVAYNQYPIPRDIVPASGTLATAWSSSAAKGKIIVDSVLDALVTIVEHCFNSEN